MTIRVERGEPTPEELAALVAVLALVTDRRQRPPARPPRPPSWSWHGHQPPSWTSGRRPLW